MQSSILLIKNKFMQFKAESNQDPHYHEYTEGGAACVNNKPRELAFTLFSDKESQEAIAWLRGYDDAKKTKEKRLEGEFGK